jgi:methylenetetrahydrofolate reductase (NADPH)
MEPEFFSVTYGAGGSTRDNTKGVVKEMRAEGLSIAPHLSFGGDNETTLLQLLNEYKALGVNRIVTLRGDRPSGIGGATQLVYANQLVEFIRKHTGDHFHLEVAAYPETHPEASSYVQDIRYLKGKFDAGANSAITQYFFNVDAYFYFLDECAKEGVNQPIYPGIMPITNYVSIARFSDACGADIPRWIRKKLEAYGENREAIVAFGEEFISRFCETLLAGGAPGLHFYTMNTLEPTATIVNNIRKP